MKAHAAAEEMHSGRGAGERRGGEEGVWRGNERGIAKGGMEDRRREVKEVVWGRDE